MSQNGNKIKKAMILAAGFGTRLRPLTFTTPKPLLKVKGKSLIDYNLELLKKSGVEEVVINLHHLGDQIEKHIGDGKKYGLKVHFLNEPEILGTGGGIKNAEKFLKDGPFFVINSDVFTEINLNKVAADFFHRNCSALMVVRKFKPGEDYAHLKVDTNGNLLSFGEGDYFFAGISILTPIIFRYLKIPSCLVQDGFKQLLGHGQRISTFMHDKYWNDIGTLERLEEANK